uniref:Centrosomal protein POC5 n=1 Tax=Astyanax mexicanus TaxID=7994 RepID=A0A8B9RJM1_ASTMX
MNLALSSVEEVASRSEGESERHSGSDRSDRSGPSSPGPVITSLTEMFISEENLNRMENILDIWSNNLKSNVMTELRKWKLAFVEQHRLELKKEREKHAAHIAGINAEMDGLKELLNTYQISNQRKDEVRKYSLSLKFKTQNELLKLISAQSSRLAEQHYHLQLKKKVWAAWHSLIERDWRERVERACQARAEDVCQQLSADYEAKMLEKAQAEIQRLHTEKERYEESMKKAFMRGVCALNIEALSMFQTGEQDALLSGEEPSSSSMTSRPLRPTSSARLSPIPMESPVQPVPTRSNTEDIETVSQMVYLRAYLSSTARIVTAGQQKAPKMVTARITGRSELAKTSRPPSKVHVMGVVPPMSSVVVERHHPVTQLTVGQATAAKFPRSAHQSRTGSSTKSSSSQPRGHASSAFHFHSIKVVD